MEPSERSSSVVSYRRLFWLASPGRPLCGPEREHRARERDMIEKRKEISAQSESSGRDYEDSTGGAESSFSPQDAAALQKLGGNDAPLDLLNLGSERIVGAM